jgi:hypothetical protein
VSINISGISAATFLLLLVTTRDLFIHVVRFSQLSSVDFFSFFMKNKVLNNSKVHRIAIYNGFAFVFLA